MEKCDICLSKGKNVEADGQFFFKDHKDIIIRFCTNHRTDIPISTNQDFLRFAYSLSGFEITMKEIMIMCENRNIPIRFYDKWMIENCPSEP